MTSDEIRSEDNRGMSEKFWLQEIAAQLAETNELKRESMIQEKTGYWPAWVIGNK